MKFAVVICGPIGSGKSAATADLASELGLKVVSFGGYVRAVAEQTGSSSNREMLQDLGENLFKSKGASGLLQAALEYAGIGSDDSVVFDGVRHSGVLTEIRRTSETTIAVFLRVSREERYRRHKARLSSGISLDGFIVIDSHPVEAETNKLDGLCELVIDATLPVAEMLRTLRSQISLLVQPGD